MPIVVSRWTWQLSESRYAREQEFHDQTHSDRWQAIEKDDAVTGSSHAEFYA